MNYDNYINPFDEQEEKEELKNNYEEEKIEKDEILSKLKSTNEENGYLYVILAVLFLLFLVRWGYQRYIQYLNESVVGNLNVQKVSSNTNPYYFSTE